MATFTWRITFDPVLDFKAEITLEEFVTLLSPATRAALSSALSSQGAQLADALFEEILDAVIRVREDTADEINEARRLLGGMPLLDDAAEGEEEPIVLYEGDAVALAFEFVELDRSRLRAWEGTSRAPFLEGIDEHRVSEEQLLDHDARHFGDWRIVQDALVGAVTFDGTEGRRLTVMNVNREPIERTLGVDLIYYHHNFECYVLVQYKRMQRTEGDAEFRPDEQLEKELARMRTIVLDETDPAEPNAYRLDHHCCFLKLCWPTTRDVYAGDIAKGMYFPLAYWDLLVKSPVAVGPKGGKRLRGQTVGRRLDRTGFVRLVRDAWIGSRGVTTEEITKVIQSGLDANRSLILAAGKSTS